MSVLMAKLSGRVEARADRQDERDQDSRKGKPRASLNNRNNNTCQHIFSF